MHETDEFDYIVIGSGSGGAAAGVRLAQGGKHTVLIVEAGPPAKGLWTKMPLGSMMLISKGTYIRDFFTEPDPNLNNRQIYWPRGWVEGGCTTINGLMWVHGTPHLYDKWAADGANGWGYRDLLPWFRKIEHYMGDGDPAYRGKGGPIGVTEFKPIDPAAEAFMDAYQASGVGPRVKDYNAGGFGISRMQFNTRQGVRESMVRTYIEPNRGLRNLTLATDTLVTRILLEGKRAVGVQARSGGRDLHFKARREVILAGGTFNSAQLLELSGVGRREVLEAAGVPLVHELPMVGENLSEHVYCPLTYRSKPGISWNKNLGTKRKVLDGMRWMLRRDGRLTSLTITTHGFASSTPGSTEADMKLQIAQVSSSGNRGKGQRTMDPFDAVTLAGFQICPYSRGSTHITSTDPAANPRMISNHFKDPRDMEMTLKALRSLRRIAEAAPLAKWLINEERPGPKGASDEGLADHLRASGATAYHPVGSCRIGGDATNSVVDPHLQVHGLEGLRIADCSVMPTIAATNTNAIGIVIGERAADFVLNEQA